MGHAFEYLANALWEFDYADLCSYVYIDLGGVFITYISELCQKIVKYFLRGVDTHHTYHMQSCLAIFLSRLEWK